jgi:hypothetical protein
LTVYGRALYFYKVNSKLKGDNPMKSEKPGRESPSESEERRLNLEKAQGIAGLTLEHLRAEGKKEGWTGEDYEQALRAVEELKGLAEEEPGTKKALFALSRLPSRMAEMVLDGLASAGSFNAGAERPEHINLVPEFLNDAANKLKALKDQAEQTER